MSLHLTTIGRTNKTHGFDGTLRITIEDAFFEDFVAAEVVFLETGGQPTPFFVEDRWGSGDLFLKLEEIDDKESARGLTNKVLSLRAEDVSSPSEASSLPDASHPYAKWIGYTIVDKNQGEIGVIDEIAELPEQFLAILMYQGEEVMIPLHEKLIVEVVHPQKRVVMDLPEGLLGI